MSLMSLLLSLLVAAAPNDCKLNQHVTRTRMWSAAAHKSSTGATSGGTHVVVVFVVAVVVGVVVVRRDAAEL